MAGKRIPYEEKKARIQAKIDRAQATLDRAKAEMKALEDKKNNAKRDEVVDLVMSSGMSLDEIKELFASKEQ